MENKVYKALRVDNRELKSVYAGHYTGTHYKEDLKGVTYVEGHISYAPEGQQGLAIWANIEAAVDFCNCNNVGKMVVHEATALGKKGRDLMHDKNGATYPAILLGKEVWREEEPKFKVGDRIKVTAGCYKGKVFIITESKWADMRHKHWHYYDGTSDYPIDECWLELAPKEEWVDVTKECRPNWLGAYCGGSGQTIAVYHNTVLVTRFGIGQPALVDGRYKVEEVSHNYQGQMSTFTILKKVV